MDETSPVDDVTKARNELGIAIRRLHHSVVGRESSAEALRSLAAELHSRCDALDAGSARSRPTSSFDYASGAVPEDGALLPAGYGDRPYGGESSPYGLDFEVYREGDNTVRAEVTLHAAHEGAPGRSHGGIVAGFFDDLTGFVQQLTRTSAYTGELTIRYQAPVPLFVPLVGRAWVAGTERRKIFVEADLRDGDSVLATCKAIYIAVPAFG